MLQHQVSLKLQLVLQLYLLILLALFVLLGFLYRRRANLQLDEEKMRFLKSVPPIFMGLNRFGYSMLCLAFVSSRERRSRLILPRRARPAQATRDAKTPPLSGRRFV